MEAINMVKVVGIPVVTTEYIADGAITTAKLADGAVVYPKMVFDDDQVADQMNKLPLDDATKLMLGFDYTFIADAFNSNNITATRIRDILAHTRVTADKAQSILYDMCNKLYVKKLADILTYGATDVTYSANTTITDQVIRYRNLTVNSGVTLSINNLTSYFLVYNLVNNGTIKNIATVAGGAAGATGAGAGGTGSGSLVFVNATTTAGTIIANGGNGGNGTDVAANGYGGGGAAGVFYLVSGYSPGTGGNGGNAGTTYGLGTVDGGGGGSNSGAYYGGNGGSSTVTTYTTLKALATDLLKSIADWWLVNVLAKTPTTTKSLWSMKGCGGGGGAAFTAETAAGGGGGGAGEVIIISDSVTAGSISAKGGNGGNGGTEGAKDAAGGGGGGGVAYVLYHTLAGTFTFTLSGGAGGTGDYNGAAGGTGSSYLESY